MRTAKMLWDDEPILLFESLADAFKRTHGMLAPGKDEPAEFGRERRWEEKSTRYAAWRSLLGPSDLACLIALYEMHERDRE